jgi:PAS domain S-box-containing protein
MSTKNTHSYDNPESLAWAWGLVESAVEGVVTIDERGGIEYMNTASCRLFGYDESEALGKNIRVLMPDPYSSEHDDYLNNYLTTGIQKVIGIGREVVGLRKDGSTFPMHLSISEVEVEGTRRFTGLIHDITRERNAQAEKNSLLKELNWRNKELNCLYQTGELLRGNQLTQSIRQEIVHILDATLSRSEITGIKITIDGAFSANPSFQSTPWRLCAEILVEERKRGMLEVCLIQDPVQLAHLPENDIDDTKSLIQAIARQLGEALAHQEAEQKVIHASKLASIGELAAGMGHEINNPVNGIINCADILLKQAEAGSKTAEFAELIRSEATRIARIVRDLLTFSRQDTTMFSAAEITDIVDTVVTLSRKNLEKSHIELNVDIDESVPRLECRSEQLQQVLMNLVINATHALNDKYPGADNNKSLTIRARAHELDGIPGVRISVIDTGTGISSAHIERIYDPFFTTKGRDSGTGLGLSVSDGIVKNHNGTISVDTKLGDYTAFHVDVPAKLQRENN